MQTEEKNETTVVTQDNCPLLGIDHLELYVGNAKQAAYFYQSAFGFQPLAYAGPETGVKDKASYVLAQGNIRLVLSCSLIPVSEIAAHVNMHGDGVKVIALKVNDAEKAYQNSIERGARSYLEPQESEDDHGKISLSGIHTYGDTVHVFIDRSNYKGLFAPGYKEWKPSYCPGEVGLKEVDHLVGNVDWMQMNVWTKFYEEVLGFNQLVSFDDKDISTEYSALMSKVMSDGEGKIKFPINEPAVGKRKSQVEEYLIFYKGAGVQHIALETDDIISTVSQLKERGVEFLNIPTGYYDTLSERCGEIEEELSSLKELGVLVDRDEDGYLLQIFTKPVEDRPTVFFEIIQRRGARSFGKGNFKALFETIEKEQALRGNL